MNDSPVAYLIFPRHQQQPRGSSKRSRPLENQPFPGLLQPENLSREQLIDVLRASVLDQKGEGERDGCTETQESSLPLQPSRGLFGLPTKAFGVKSLFCFPLVA